MIIVFDQVTNKWSEVSSFNNIREWCTLVSCGGFLHGIGGRAVNSAKEKVALNTVERYSCRTNVIEETTQMIEGRWNASAVSIHSKIFVVGGFGADRKILVSCEVLDFETNQSSLISPMRIARRGFGIAVNGAQILCTGGYEISSGKIRRMKSSEFFNVTDGTWQVGKDLVEKDGKDFGWENIFSATIFD